MSALKPLSQANPRARPFTGAERWAGSGHVPAGRAPDSRSAGREAAEVATAGRSPELVLVFASDSHDLDALLGGVRSVTAEAPLAGCTTAGEISGSGIGDGGVVVFAAGGDGLRTSTSVGMVGEGQEREAGAQAAECLGAVDSDLHRALLLLVEGVGCNATDVIRGVHEAIGSGTPLVGGCAGDGMRMQRTFQLCDDEVVSGGVVGVAISSREPIGIGWSHGWERAGDPMLVTRASANKVLEIDGEPALDAYLRRLDAPDEVREDAELFTRWARTRPLGLGRRRNGHEPVRCVSAADFDRRALVCTGEVPGGGLAWFMSGDADSVLRSTVCACEEATAALGGLDPQGMLVFDCIGRRGVLGEARIGEEVQQIAQAAPGAAVAGLYTYGEIARVTGVNALHSQTVAAMALA